MFNLNYHTIFVQSIQPLQLNILRLDELHPIVSGNKWFKLQLQLQDAIKKNHTSITTFGGAYSNHIVATAFACQKLRLNSAGIIRGDEPKTLNHTLLAARQFGMQLQFVSRKAYANKQQFITNTNTYYINEGGYAVLGANGIAEITKWIDESYTHIVCAVGTGTMMAGLIKGVLPHQKVVGISVLKGNTTLLQQVKALLNEPEKDKQFELIDGYHFGGYAKHPQALISWMNMLYKQHQLPTDIVYTSKLLFAVTDLQKQEYFGEKSKIMVVHSGGLQGNLSLPAGTLVF
ncbi:MAG: pyridoxal-phosphate dependent enzyme [Deinococcales bacterium]|nr:pyridoxal-phosphate dependent enzyme [Chitinophagaceae bacterium]